jgi:thiol-disulfide isomerase/thioredoxin
MDETNPKNFRKLATVCLAVCAGGLSVACLIMYAFTSRPSTTYSSPQQHVSIVNQQAPEITIHRLKNGPIDLSSLKGHVVVVDFWATWCPSCRLGLPILEKLADKYKNKGVRFLAISDEAPSEIAAYILNNKFHNLEAASDPAKSNAIAYHVNKIPSTVIVGKDGVVRWNTVGVRSDEEERMASELDSALKEN